MPDTTPIYALPYQLPADPPDGAALGQELAEAVEAALVDFDDQVAGRPNAQLLLGTPTFTHNVITAITPTSAPVNVGSMWTSGSNLTIPVGGGGLYRMGIVLRYASQATAAGVRQARINVAGAEHILFNMPTTTGFNASNIIVAGETRAVLAAGDTVTFLGYQSSGVSLALTGNSVAWLEKVP